MAKLSKQLKKGMTVEVLAGKDKGKSGKVVQLDREAERVVIEGVNVYKKHQRPRRQGQKGEIIEVPRSMHISNVKIAGSSSKK